MLQDKIEGQLFGLRTNIIKLYIHIRVLGCENSFPCLHKYAQLITPILVKTIFCQCPIKIWQQVLGLL